MTPEIVYDEGADEYQIGATIDGVFVHFITVPGTTVQSRIASVKQSQAEQASQAPPPPTGTPGY